MRILISADIGGVADVFHPEQTRADNDEYERARRWMTAGADAAVRGTFDGGTTDMLVSDSHGGFRNLIPDSIDRRTRFVLSKPRYLNMMAGVDGCNAACMIGYHARAGNRGVLAHTINSSAFAHIWSNEQKLGEAGLYGTLARKRGVSVTVASGNDVFIKETKPLLPHTIFVEARQAEGQNAGISLSPKQSCEAIYAAVKTTVRRNHFSVPLRLWTPIVYRLQTQTPALVDPFCQWPVLERVDDTILRFAADSVEHTVRMLNSFSAMSAILC